MLDQWRVSPMKINTTVIVAMLPADHANTLSVQEDPLASQAKNSAAMSRMTKRIIYFTGLHSGQYTGNAPASDLPEECWSEMATDVTRIAVPMAFCRGVKVEQPVVSASKQTNSVFIDPPFFGESSIAQVSYGN